MGVQFELFVIGYPRDFHVNYARFNGFLPYVFYLREALLTFSLKRNSQKAFLIPKFVIDTYMLFAGWEVRLVKNCNRGLENAARGRRPKAAQFFTIRTEPKPANNMFIFFSALNWFCRVQMDVFTLGVLLKNLGNERVTQIVDKERCIKEDFFFRTTLC